MRRAAYRGTKRERKGRGCQVKPRHRPMIEDQQVFLRRGLLWWKDGHGAGRVDMMASYAAWDTAMQIIATI
jgi:hypothetical protein